MSFGNLGGGARLALLAALALGLMGLAPAAAEAKRLKIRTRSEPGGAWLIDRATVAPLRREEAATAATTPGRAEAAQARARRLGRGADRCRRGAGGRGGRGGEAARHRPRGRRRLNRRLLSQRLGLSEGSGVRGRGVRQPSPSFVPARPSQTAGQPGPPAPQR